MLDNRSDSRQLLGQARNHAWMVGSETVSPLDLESVTDQIALKSTRDSVLELGAAARGRKHGQPSDSVERYRNFSRQ